MGRIILICRLARHDLRRRPAQALLLLLAVAAAATTLTLGLLVRAAADDPWERTRAATAGPDAVATASDARSLRALAKADGVTGALRPLPTVAARLGVRDVAVNAVVQGRDVAAGSIDQPFVTSGAWLRPGSVVVERAFADALRVRPGDAVTLAGRRFTVAGIAVTTGRAPYPSSTPGLIWTTRADAARLPAAQRRWTMPLRLADPSAAPAFAARHPGVTPWQDLSAYATAELRLTNNALISGAWALAILAGLCVALLVGGRLAEQGRRVGLLKAAGATPAVVAVTLLAEHLAVALAAAALGLLAGRAAAPLLSGPNAGLLAGDGPALTPGITAAVLLFAVAVTATATAFPALRGARVSTAHALRDPVRPPRRVGVPPGLPVTLLLGLRIAARRVRRTVLAALSTAVTVAMIVAALAMNREAARKDGRTTGPDFVPGAGNPVTERVTQIILVLAAAMLLLAAVNAILTAWTTTLDTKRTSALARALGATPRQITGGLAAAHLIPATIAATAGIPLGLLINKAAHAAAGSSTTTQIPLLWLAAVLPAALAATTALTAVPLRKAATHPIAPTLTAP
ncbi:FtsX-like permease family protein [Actinomadura atramentaria]|uniref:FtsX-like permease family protein n=1 Tax=Actinomadura atramentaria TaxID=1990 RepID=UPI00037CF193|nr:FtsX-like permease family protein [Actinomadura atramentaria]